MTGHDADPTSKPPAWWPEGAKASMNPPQRSEVTDPPHVQQLRQDITTCQHLTKTDPTRYYQGLAEGIQRALDILGHTQEQK